MLRKICLRKGRAKPHMSNKAKSGEGESKVVALRCEGYRRRGGAFTFGPVSWAQCENRAVVFVTIDQGGEITKDCPCCLECWSEGIEQGIKQIDAKPIPGSWIPLWDSSDT
jgi:hypothetical protein